MERRIEIAWARRWNGAVWVGHGLYYAAFDGERIGEWRVPGCSAARWLLGNGKAERSDTLVMCRDGKPAMRGNVGWMADHTVEENERVGPRWAKFHPFVARLPDVSATVGGGNADGFGEGSS